MSGILDLAFEPLSEIISYLETLEWISLWFCGDSRMNWRLGRGKAVRKMEIGWWPGSTCLWPSQIIKLDGLETFSLRRGLSAPNRPFSALHLSTLSQNLKKLELQDAASLDALDGDFSAISSFPPKLAHLHFLDFDSSLLRFLPKSLQSFKFNQNSWKDSCRLSLLSISSLPRSLTSLSLPPISIDDTNPDVLESFYSSLPLTLTELEYGSTEDLFLFLSSSSSLHLPRGLKSLQILKEIEFSLCNMAEWILGLPETLTSLEFNVNPPPSRSAFSAFGALINLKKLLIEIPKPPASWAKRIDFRSLPRSLTQFELNDAPYGSIDELDSDITNDVLIGAPRSLRSLLLPASSLLSQECLVHLPNLASFEEPEGHTPTWFKY
jgi:hypothetical protein